MSVGEFVFPVISSVSVWTFIVNGQQRKLREELNSCDFQAHILRFLIILLVESALLKLEKLLMLLAQPEPVSYIVNLE